MKIGRNDACPCESGLKYKKCCLVHQERTEAAESLNSQYIDRDYIITDLKRRSPAMVHFFDAVPPHLIQNLWLFVSPNLNANMRSLLGYGHYCIIFRQVPISDEDFFDFAHEICHIIFSLRKYPMCGVKRNDPSLTYLATILTNTLMDPMVNSLVVKSGFDLVEYMSKAIREQSSVIKSASHNTTEGRHFLRCLCIEKMLEWRILDIPFENAFLPIFSEFHPNEYRFASEYVDSIDVLRLGDPQYVRDALARLIAENQMQDILYLA